MLIPNAREQPIGGRNIKIAPCALVGLGLALIPVCFLSTAQSRPEIHSISNAEANEKVFHLLPLPKEIDIPSKWCLKRTDIRIRIPDNSNPNEVFAASLVTDCIDIPETRPNEAPELTVLVGLLDENGKVDGVSIPGGERLADLPNSEQAYRIVPVGDHTLSVSAHHPEGLVFGARTLCQLLEIDSQSGDVKIPFATITDWPDLEERGVWNYPQTSEWIEWMSELKLNYGNLNPAVKEILKNEPNKMTLDTDLVEYARLRGFRLIPQIVHLNFLEDFGLFRAYPDLAGLGETALAGRYIAHKTGPMHRVPDASNPKLVEILSEWMEDIASQGSMEICCWLSERPATDNRRMAIEEGQFVLESRAFVQAHQKARLKFPELGIRIFLSTTTDERYYKIYDELPVEMKIFRCCVTDLERVRHLPRDLFRNPLLDHYAEQGRWIGTYDVPLNVNGNVETPEFKIPHRSPQRIKDYVTQLVARKYSAGIGMMAWHRHAMKTCGMNIAALAEWGWNANGRTAEEFALAWAIREGFEEPGDLAEWIKIMGPVEWDVFDSEFPTCYSWGRLAELVKNRDFPLLGESFFRYYSSAESFDEKITQCDKALSISSSFKDSDYANETRVVRSYVQLAKSIYSIAELRASDPLTRLESQEEMKVRLSNLEQAGVENVESIRRWRMALGPEEWHYRVKDAIAGTENTVKEIVEWVRHRDLY